MKKYLYALISTIFILNITGCGDNKTKEKLVGTTVITASGGGLSDSGEYLSAQAAQMACFYAQAAAGMSSGNFTAPARNQNQNQNQIQNQIQKTAGFDESECPTTGWIIMTQYGYTFRFRYLQADGSPITGANMVAIMLQLTLAKSFQFRANGSEYGYSIDTDMTITFSSVGTYTSGGTVSGSLTMRDSYQNTCTCTFTNLVCNALGLITSGTMSMTMNSLMYGAWSASLTFSSSGDAVGTIRGPNYSATIVIYSNGTGYYTDSSGTHYIS